MSPSVLPPSPVIERLDGVGDAQPTKRQRFDSTDTSADAASDVGGGCGGAAESEEDAQLRAAIAASLAQDSEVSLAEDSEAADMRAALAASAADETARAAQAAVEPPLDQELNLEPLSEAEFEEAWHATETTLGSLHDIEHGALVREGNNSGVSAAEGSRTNQSKAQVGRLV